jgi:hypothetical protein
MISTKDRRIQGSPTFTFENPLIAASGEWFKDLGSDKTYNGSLQQFLPLNSMIVANTSSNRLKLYINEDESRVHIIGGNLSYILKPADAKGLRSWRLVDMTGTSIAAGTFSVSVWLEAPDINTVGQKLAQMLRLSI